MTAESTIATHDSPAGRERSNYIIRLDLSQDGMPGHFEQVWTRTTDQMHHELCCIPFFTYGLSLGDVLILTSAEGAYRVETKSGHRTLRIAVQDDKYAHEHHGKLHDALVQLGVLTEFGGHSKGYGAVDIANQRQAEAVVSFLSQIADAGTLIWEWADPVVA